METFFYSFSEKYDKITFFSPKFRTTFNETYFAWQLIRDPKDFTSDWDWHYDFLDLQLQETNSVMPCINDVIISVTPIAKKNAEIDLCQLDKFPTSHIPNRYCRITSVQKFKNFRKFSENRRKFFVKISIPRKYFDKHQAFSANKPVDRLIMLTKMAENLFDHVIGVVEADKSSDIVLTSSDGRKYFCHKFVLSASSDVFETLFKGRSDCDKNEIKTNDIDEETMATVLRFIYKNEIDEFNLSGPLAEKVLYAAEKYNLQELKSKCEARLKFYLDHSNALHYLELAEKFSLESLSFACLKILHLFEHLMNEADFAEVFGNHASVFLKMVKMLNTDNAVI